LLASGTRIGQYEVVVLLGRGGMGEVYRARDTKLLRDVALKLLPAELASDPDRLARFTREAQLLASLNHQHIGGIYGVEETASGAALVLEFVEGSTLAERIARGPVPPEDAVDVARQIAEALEIAHERGIVHRDLKPANIALRPDGTVKVLDFGLAQAASAQGSSEISPASVTESPTFTNHATAAGIILGTAAYMAPEQARGRPVDRRADIWAFGVVLFEMLAGRRPFGGETVSDTLAAVIKDPPEWTELPAHVPQPLRHLLRRTLEKEPRRRLRDIGDARLVLEDLKAGTADAAAAPASRWSVARALPWALAIVATSVATYLGWQLATRKVASDRVLKYTLPISGDSLDRQALPTLSPDGRYVAFIKAGSLWVQALDQLEPRQIAGTSGAQFPFWSPDSRQVAYLTGTALWRVALDGDQPVRIAASRFSKGGRTPGGVWCADGTIVFAPSAAGSGMLSVSSQGGEFSQFLARNTTVESDFHRPSLLPDGRSLLFVVDHLATGADTIGVLINGVRKDVFTVTGDTLDSPVYSPTGHILFQRETTTPGVWALPFSIERLEVTGAPFLVAAQGSYPNVSSEGTLIYAEDTLSGVNALAWVDVGTGAATPALHEQFPVMRDPDLSPNGRMVAVVVQSPEEGGTVIVADLQRNTHVKIGNRADGNSRPTWLNDQTVVYSRTNERGRSDAIVMHAADGSGNETVLTEEGMQPRITAGRMVFSRINPGYGGDLYQMLLPAGGSPRPPEVIQQTATHEWQPQLSPDGTLLAYSSGDYGQSEVILRTFPAQTGRWQVSSNGGSLPVWSPSGDAIYYRDVPGDVMRVSVRIKPQIVLGAPVIVQRPLNVLARPGFDVSSDGTRLLMVQEVRIDGQHPPSLAVVQNWFAQFQLSSGRSR
jgi:serine/threonine-protein kinase